MLFIIIGIVYGLIIFIAFFGNTEKKERDKENKKFKEIMGYDYE